MDNFFSAYRDGEIQFLMNDFNVESDLCNFRCDYCLVEEAPDTKKKQQELVNIFSKERNDARYQYMVGALDQYNQLFKTPILRICGGELFYMKDMIGFLESIHHKFEKVQIISNGYYLDRSILKRIKEMGNCILHISLDGHIQELNQRRIKSKEQQARLMDHIHAVLELKIPLEIASCLTDANTADYEEVVRYFYNTGGEVLLLPFPVRGKQCEQFQPSEEAVNKFRRLLERYSRYQSILPPIAYMERLLDFYDQGQRTVKCHIPQTVIQTFHNGDISACCMDWSVKIGNLNEMTLKEIENALRGHKIYRLYAMDPPRLYACKFCFTISEIINLYLEDKITAEEMYQMHLFNGSQTREVLDKIKFDLRRTMSNEYE